MVVGLDVHKKQTVGFVVERDLQSGVDLRFPTTDEGLTQALPRLRGHKVLIEASTSGKAAARWLKRRGVDVDLVHADVLTTFLRRNKSDKLDARDLARIGLLGGYKTCYLPTEEEDALRSLTRHIRDTRDHASQLQNQIRAIAQRNLVPEPMGRLRNANVRARWTRLSLPRVERIALMSKLSQLTRVLEEEENAMVELCALTQGNRAVAQYLTVKGVEAYTATTIAAYCGDMHRFPSGKHVASYGGLTPRLHASGEVVRHGRITKSGPNVLRHALVEAAHNVVRYPGRLRNKFQRLKGRIGAGRAIVAIARTLITALWAMTVKNQPYEGMHVELTTAKAWRIQTVAQLHAQGEHEAARRLLRTAAVQRAHENYLRGTSKMLPS